MANEWFSIMPKGLDPTPHGLDPIPNGTADNNMPIGINAAYTSIACLDEDVIEASDDIGLFLYVACCDSGQVILRRGILNFMSAFAEPDYLWGAANLFTPPEQPQYCSFTILVANQITQTLFLGFIERVSQGDKCTKKIPRVWRKAFGTDWEPINPGEHNLDVDFLSLTLDRKFDTDALHIAYIDANKNVFTQFLKNASTDTDWEKESIVYIPGTIDKPIANNVSIAAFNNNQYIAFSNFAPPLPLQSTGAVTDDQRTRVMRKLEGAGWMYYGQFVGQPGFASSPNEFGSGPTFYNSIAIESEELIDEDPVAHLYLAHTGGLSNVGGSQVPRSFSKDPVPDWVPEMAFQEPVDSPGPFPGIFVTSSFDENNILYILFFAAELHGVKVYQCQDGAIISSMHLQNTEMNVALYLSLTAKANNLFLAFTDIYNRVNVYTCPNVVVPQPD